MQNGLCLDVAELCFVRYFDVLSKEKLKIDKVDIIFGCLRLRWPTTSGKVGKISAEKEHGLVSIGAIRGTVNLVPRNTMLHVIDGSEPHAVGYFSMCDGVDGW